METNSIDEDILTMHESASLRQIGLPTPPLSARVVDEIHSESRMATLEKSLKERWYRLDCQCCLVECIKWISLRPIDSLA